MGTEIDAYILTIPSMMNEARKTHRHVVRHGFPPEQVHIIIGKVAKNRKDVTACSEAICESHWIATQKGLRRMSHILIVEDDCRFVRILDAYKRLQAAIEYLEHIDPKWRLLSVGHCPLGPIVPVGDGIVRTSLPFCGHCYMLNRRFIRPWMKSVGKRYWKRPLAVEGWKSVSTLHKYGFFDSLATQNRPPKEMVRTGTAWFGVTRGLRMMNWIMILGVPLIVFILTVLAIYVYIRH